MRDGVGPGARVDVTVAVEVPVVGDDLPASPLRAGAAERQRRPGAGVGRLQRQHRRGRRGSAGATRAGAAGAAGAAAVATGARAAPGAARAAATAATARARFFAGGGFVFEVIDRDRLFRGAARANQEVVDRDGRHTGLGSHDVRPAFARRFALAAGDDTPGRVVAGQRHRHLRRRRRIADVAHVHRQRPLRMQRQRAEGPAVARGTDRWRAASEHRVLAGRMGRRHAGFPSHRRRAAVPGPRRGHAESRGRAQFEALRLVLVGDKRPRREIVKADARVRARRDSRRHQRECRAEQGGELCRPRHGAHSTVAGGDGATPIRPARHAPPTGHSASAQPSPRRALRPRTPAPAPRPTAPPGDSARAWRG